PKILSYLWPLLLLGGCAHVPDHTASFRSANAQLRQGQYAPAICQYQQLERQGVRQPALFCNLGNAFYQSGRVGWAVYYYEKALALAPLDEQLLANRRAAQSQLPAPAAAPTPWPLPTTPRIWQTADNAAAIAAFSIFISSILYLVATVAKGRATAPRVLASSRVLLLVGALLLAAAGGLLWPLQQRAAIITRPRALLRSGPSSRARQIAEVSEGEKVSVQAYYGGWLKVQTASGAKGWISTLSAARLSN
ncbi:MAG: tetratricopeptide repeat protein, partial [Hymenobacter sp.]